MSISLAILATCVAVLEGSASASGTNAARYSVLKTSLPGGQKLPPGAVVAATTRFDGKLVAAGDDIPAGSTPVLKACAPEGCDPVVWISNNGTKWTATWGTSPTGSIPGELLLEGRGMRLLFDDDEATRLWSSLNGVSWHQVDLPASMGGLGVRDAVFAHGRYEAMLNNKYAGGPTTAYGQSDAVWSSLNTQTWIYDKVPGPPAAFDSISETRTGFRLVGNLRHGGAPAVWTSVERRLDEIQMTGIPTPLVLVNPTPRAGIVRGQAPRDSEGHVTHGAPMGGGASVWVYSSKG
jgi:hypothetical protein